MPLTITAEHPRHDLIVQGKTVKAPHIFAAGHQLSESEAGFLNRALTNRVGSAFGQKLKKQADSKKVDLDTHLSSMDLQAEFDRYMAEFDLDATRGTAATIDPIDARARQLADKAFRELPKVKAAGVSKLQKAKRADGTSQWTFLVNQYLEQHPNIRELAAQQIEAERALKASVGGESTTETENFDDLLDGVVAEPEAAPAGEPAGEAGAAAE
jgi:hypothetical protein